MIQVMSIVTNIFQAIIIYQFADRMLKRKKSQKMVMSFWILGLLISEIQARLISIVWCNTITTVIIILFLCVFLYKNEFKRKLMIALYIESFMMVSELIVNVVLICVVENINKDKYFMLGSTISKMLFFLFLSLVILMGIDKENVKIDTKTWISIVLVPLCSMIMILIFYCKSIDERLGVEDLCFYVSALLINYIAVVQYLNLQKMSYLDNKNKELAQESKYYLNQCELTNDMLENIRTIKHDIKNEYIVDRKLLKDKMYAELDDRYAKKLENMDLHKVYYKTGNIYVDSIINYKASQIINLGGEFVCKMNKFDSEIIDNSDVIVILGNLLDNVIDALSSDELEDKNCYFRLFYDKPNLVISVKNNYAGIRKNNGKDRYFTTKKDDKIHGIGLRSVRNVLEKYNGVMEINDKDKVFEVSVHICEE